MLHTHRSSKGVSPQPSSYLCGFVVSICGQYIDTKVLHTYLFSSKHNICKCIHFCGVKREGECQSPKSEKITRNNALEKIKHIPVKFLHLTALKHSFPFSLLASLISVKIITKYECRRIEHCTTLK